MRVVPGKPEKPKRRQNAEAASPRRVDDKSTIRKVSLRTAPKQTGSELSCLVAQNDKLPTRPYDSVTKCGTAP